MGLADRDVIAPDMKVGRNLVELDRLLLPLSKIMRDLASSGLPRSLGPLTRRLLFTTALCFRSRTAL